MTTKKKWPKDTAKEKWQSSVQRTVKLPPQTRTHVLLLLERTYRAFACDVMGARMVYLDKRILNIFF